MISFFYFKKVVQKQAVYFLSIKIRNKIKVTLA